MKSITLKAKGGVSFEIHAYKAGESVTVFKGATGTFGRAVGSKTAGIVYVVKGPNGVTADDMDVDNAAFWDWIQDKVQKGLAV